MAKCEVRVPKTIKPCVIAMAQAEGEPLAAMAVTWITQIGHGPEMIISVHEQHNTYRVAIELGWLVLANATPELCKVFDKLGSTTGNDGVDKLQILQDEGVAVAYNEDGIPWLPDARDNSLYEVGQIATTQDGYAILSCKPIKNLGGSNGDQLYYAGRDAQGGRIYGAAAITPIVLNVG